MPGNPHPFEQPYADRDGSALLGATKLHLPMTVADVDEVSNTDLSVQFGGLFVRSKSARYYLDTEDTSVVDGDSVLADSAGNHFLKDVSVVGKSTLTHSTAGVDVTIADDDTAEIHKIKNTGSAAINVYLPDATTRTKPIRIVDGSGNAATYNITVLPKSGSGQTVMLGSQYVIDSDGASFGADADAVDGNWM